jgi:peptidoglycan/LPS O-acetylase OafA/YrhL
MRIEQLTFTRFIAAISIVIYHFGMDLYPFKTEAVSFLFRQANLGVSYFFILSGFVMIIAYSGNGKGRIDSKKYYSNRMARIYPAYFLALMILVVYFLVRSRSFSGMAFGLNLLVIQSWFPGYPLTMNGPGWSLAVEFFFYALYPFLFNRIYSKVSLGRIVLPVLLFWVVSQVLFNAGINSSFYEGSPSKSHDLLYYFPLMHLNEFLIGNLGGLFLLRLKDRTAKNYNVPILMLMGVLLLLLKFPLPWSYHNGLLAIIFIPFLLLLSLNKGFISRVFNLKPFVFLGEISYSIYIYQIPVFFWSKGFMTFLGITNGYAVFYLFMISLIVVSGLSYVFIETPIRNAIKGRIAKKRPTILMHFIDPDKPPSPHQV